MKTKYLNQFCRKQKHILRLLSSSSPGNFLNTSSSMFFRFVFSPENSFLRKMNKEKLSRHKKLQKLREITNEDQVPSTP